MNIVAKWLELIGTVERAKKLRARLDSLNSPPEDPNFGPEAPQCPTTVLYGAETSRKLYADPDYRPVLDAWDTGSVTKGDLRRYCFWIERGMYTSVVFYPDAAWQARLRALKTQNASQVVSMLRSRARPFEESPRSISREQRPASRDIVFH